MHQRADDYPAFVSYPGLPRRIRKVGAPLGVLITLGTIAGLIVIALTAFNPVGTAIGFVLSSVAMTVVVLAYLWLDRWEPEPPRLLVLAFLWGASVAVVIASILQLIVEAAINPGEPDTVSPWSVALGAPLVEEAAKGLFLLLMMTGRRRNELNSLTDCLVYAGLVGAGFAWLEDILYIGGGDGRRLAADRRDAADHGAVRALAVHHDVRHRGVLRAAAAKRAGQGTAASCSATSAR